ncbi:hypothetical protein MPC4_160048 [Methylocella tundrae]|uniref:Uncharacterized protein n=1 Tax=Methylocella tundrae TaxID=227605 RepID=A0A8B6M3K0_METTU|nr:hypothetical protein MPC1_4340002 [Methylocella tundrae]VTZ49398.1 hypothetical protein MPC4_160048 [Methylocella tundrae]
MEAGYDYIFHDFDFYIKHASAETAS